MEDNFMPDVVSMFASLWRPSLRIFCWLARNVQIDFAPAATEGFFLAWFAFHGWVIMLRAGLAWEEHKLFGTDPVCVDVDHQLQAGIVQLIQTEICHLDVGCLFWCNNNPGAGKVFPGLLLGGVKLFFADHLCLLNS